DRLLSGVVVHKRPCNPHGPFFLDRSAARAPAALLDGPKVGRIHLPLHIQDAMLSDGIAEPRRPCRPDTVKHVSSQGNADDEILRVTNPHYVAWLQVRKELGASSNNPTEVVFRLATA